MIDRIQADFNQIHGAYTMPIWQIAIFHSTNPLRWVERENCLLTLVWRAPQVNIYKRYRVEIMRIAFPHELLQMRFHAAHTNQDIRVYFHKHRRSVLSL